MGLPNGWLVTVTHVHQAYSLPGPPPAGTGKQYVAVDITMQNQGPAGHSVDANRVFVIVDSSHKQHSPLALPRPNGIDGAYPAGTTRSGQLVFSVPTAQDLGLILYGPAIGTKVSYFRLVPPQAPSRSAAQIPISSRRDRVA